MIGRLLNAKLEKKGVGVSYVNYEYCPGGPSENYETFP
jgi:hypothetical protein